VLQAAQVSSVVAACLEGGEEAWLVGGAVRDGLLGATSRDLDFAVRGDAQALARRLADRLDGSFFVYSEEFSTYRVMLGDGIVDFAPLRGESIQDDLAARDFTVDAMALPARGGDPGTRVGVGRVIDPLGGLRDLQARRLVPCSPQAFQDDPLRVVRLARLAVAFGLEPAPAALTLAQAATGRLQAVSGERVRQELTALLGMAAAAAGVRLLDAMGVVAVLLPELEALKDVEQNRFHHLDVYGHTLEALERVPAVVGQLGGERFLAHPVDCGLAGAPALAPLMYAVLFHDLGKPGVKQVSEDGRIMFWHHDELGAELAISIARRLGMSRRFQAYLTLLIRNHLRLGFLVREAPLTRRALVRYRRAVEPYVFESVVLSVVDRLATRGERTSAASIARHYRLAREVWLGVPKERRRPLLDGDRVMALLGLQEGPEVGAAIAALQDETDALEVRTPEEAAAFLQRWWAARQSAAGGERDAADGG
jgi:tRNA nucleotidyltransferase/poly(A) polymerase